MIHAIAGSRDYPMSTHVREFIRTLATRPSNPVILTGGAEGVDLWAQTEACKVGLRVLPPIRPDYASCKTKAERLAAPLRRNEQIVHLCDELTAFWNVHSRGTGNAIALAIAAHKLGRVFGPQGRLMSMHDIEVALNRVAPIGWTRKVVVS